MPIEIIPFVPKYSDYLSISLEELAWTFHYRWSFTDNAWYSDLSSVESGTTLLGLKFMPGGNILRPHAVTELGGIFVVDTEGKFENPNYDDFGDRFKVLYVSKDLMVDYSF